MQALVVGGLGYLGSIISDLLIQHGTRVDIADLCLFDNESILNEFHKQNGKWEFVKNHKDIEKLIDNESYDFIIWSATIDIEGFYFKFREHTQRMMDIFKKASKKTRLYNCSSYSLSYIDCKTNSDVTSILFELEKDTSAMVYRIPSLYGPSLRMRWDTIVNEMVLRFITEGELILGTDWMTKIPIAEVKNVAERIIDDARNSKTSKDFKLKDPPLVYERTFSFLELAHIIKTVFDDKENLLIHIPKLNAENSVSIECSDNANVGDCARKLMICVSNIREQLANNMLPDFLSDKYNNEAVLVPLINGLDVLERLKHG